MVYFMIMNYHKSYDSLSAVNKSIVSKSIVIFIIITQKLSK